MAKGGLAALAAQLESKMPKILCIGDKIYDTYLYGRCRRFAQEAHGCPVFEIERRETFDGGVLGVRAMVDALGGFAELLAPLLVSYKRRYVCDGRQVWRADDDVSFVAGDALEQLEQKLYATIDSVNLVLVVDYGKGCCADSTLEALLYETRKRKLPCVVSPARGGDWWRYRGASVIKCNSDEYEAASVGAGRTLWWDKTVGYVIRTTGSAGMEMLTADDVGVRLFPTVPQVPVDVVGAGDMVLAALGVALASGLTLPEACEVANVAAGIKIGRRGPACVTREEWLAALRGETNADKASTGLRSGESG